MINWRKGPPPSLGWWPASNNRDAAVYRWWDGKRWSLSCFDVYTAEYAGYIAKTKVSNSGHLIEWTDRPEWWPESSKT